MKWEFIKTIAHGIFGNREHIKRLKVPGGWLVKHTNVSGPKTPVRHSMVYVPDGEGVWDVAKEPIKFERVELRNVLTTNSNYKERTYRFNVHGGWVVLDGYYISGGEQSQISIVFFPDPKLQWEIGQENKSEHKKEQSQLTHTEQITPCRDSDSTSIKGKNVHKTVTLGDNTIVGPVKRIVEMETKSNKIMARVTIDDINGGVEITTILFPEAYNKYYHLVHGQHPVIIAGIMEKAGNAVRILCGDVQLLGNRQSEDAL